MTRDMLKKLLLDAYTEGFNLARSIGGDNAETKAPYQRGAKLMLKKLMPTRGSLGPKEVKS